MQDSRIKQLARNLVNYSCRVQPGENVLIELNGEAPELACALIEEVYRAGGRPFVNLLQEDVKEALLQNADQSLLEQTAKYEALRRNIRPARAFYPLTPLRLPPLYLRKKAF